MKFCLLLFTFSKIVGAAHSTEPVRATVLNHDARSKFVSRVEAARRADPVAAARADALEAAADAEFLCELTDNPRMLRDIRIRAENFDQEVSRRVLAEFSRVNECYRIAIEAYEAHARDRVTKINQALLAEIRYRESIERQLASTTAELAAVKRKLSEVETVLTELRARPVTPTTAGQSGSIGGRPPVVPRLRGGSS